MNAQELQISKDDFTDEISAVFVTVSSDNEIEGIHRDGNMVLTLMCPGFYRSKGFVRSDRPNTGDRLIVISGSQFDGFDGDSIWRPMWPGSEGGQSITAFKGRVMFDDDNVLYFYWQVSSYISRNTAFLIGDSLPETDIAASFNPLILEANTLFLEEVLEHDRLAIEVQPWYDGSVVHKTARFDISRVDKVFRDCPS